MSYADSLQVTYNRKTRKTAAHLRIHVPRAYRNQSSSSVAALQPLYSLFYHLRDLLIRATLIINPRFHSYNFYEIRCPDSNNHNRHRIDNL